jgi:hypothetical protein
MMDTTAQTPAVLSLMVADTVSVSDVVVGALLLLVFLLLLAFITAPLPVEVLHDIVSPKDSQKEKAPPRAPPVSL